MSFDGSSLLPLLTRVESAKADDDLSDIDRDLYAVLAPLPLADWARETANDAAPLFGAERRPGLRLTSWMLASELPVWLGFDDLDLSEAMRHERAATPGLTAVAALLRYLIQRERRDAN